MALPSENSPPLLRYGTPKKYNDFPYYYAHVEKFTGLATVLDTQNPDPNIQIYGPYKSIAATGTIFDMGLFLYGNRDSSTNFKPLARCLVAVIQREAANGPPVDHLVLMAYGGCLMDALADFVTPNNNHAQFWDFMTETFIGTVRSLQSDFDKHRHRHLELLNSLRYQVLMAYEERTWPDEVWPEFEACSCGRPWICSEDLLTFPKLRPTCFQVLIGVKAIKEHTGEDLPAELFVPFGTQYARDLYSIMLEQQEKVPGNFSAQLDFIRMIVFVLANHFERAGIKLSHSSFIIPRYVAHIADALILCIAENGGFRIQEMNVPATLLWSHWRTPVQHAFKDIVKAYNKRQWPVRVWSSLLQEINSNPDSPSNPNSASNPRRLILEEMYATSAGRTRHGSIDMRSLVQEREQWASEDRGSEGENEIEEYENEERLYDCFHIPVWCEKCKGPSSVTYRFRWVCKSDHSVEGWEEETHGPFTIMNPDCASRINDEVRKIFRFATEFQDVRCNERYRAPTFVEGSCSNYLEPDVVHMVYQNDHWTIPTRQE